MRVWIDLSNSPHRWGASNRAEVALSHNSYAQIVAARSLRIPTVTAMDFEHQPANNVAFRLATTVLLPEAIPDAAVRRQGARPAKTRRYPGLKESIYLGDFEPDPSVVERLGIDRGDGHLVVLARTAPTGALYHQFGNPIFERCLQTLAGQPRVRTVVLPRNPDQARALRALGDGVIVPPAPIDSRSLMWEADLVLGAGGTMTREAALMGVPTLGLFAGSRPAVDLWLERRGMLHRLERADELRDLDPRPRPPRPIAELREEGRAALEAFVAAVEEAGPSSPRAG
jgi:predicted glycosyltransferase